MKALEKGRNQLIGLIGQPSVQNFSFGASMILEAVDASSTTVESEGLRNHKPAVLFLGGVADIAQSRFSTPRGWGESETTIDRPEGRQHRYDNAAKVGLGLWNFAALAFVIETAMFFGGIYLYLPSEARRRASIVIFAFVMLAVHAFTFFGAPPRRNAPQRSQPLPRT
jgi:hypothetical protein